MIYLNACAELDDLGKGRFRSIVHLKPVAYLDNGVYRLSSANVAAYADGTYNHAVLTASMGVRIGDDGRYAVHPTRELARYAAFGGPQVKVGGKWTQVPFSSPTRKDNAVVWTRTQADLRLAHIGHGLKHELALKGGYVPEDNLIAEAVNLVGLTRSGPTLLADGVPVARIQAPVVYDAANRLDTRPIKWDVAARDGQPYIVYTLPDLAGMAEPVVDPTLTLQPDAASGEDVRLVSGGSSLNYGAGTILSSGRFLADSNVHRVLLRFDVSGIPVAAALNSASLYMYIQDTTYSYAATTLDLYEIVAANADWVEGSANGSAQVGSSCWNKKIYNTTNWAGAAGLGTAGTDYINTTIGTLTVPNPVVLNSEFSTAITTTVVDGWRTTNNGMLLRATTESGSDNGASMYSSDDATAGTRPKLVVEYTILGGGSIFASSVIHSAIFGNTMVR